MKEIDDPTKIKTRLNDYVSVLHEVTEEGYEWREEEKEYRENKVYQVYVDINIGDCNISYYIVGSLLRPLEDWEIIDIHFQAGTINADGNDWEVLVNHDFENIETKVANDGNESLRTWLKEFREKARV